MKHLFQEMQQFLKVVIGMCCNTLATSDKIERIAPMINRFIDEFLQLDSEASGVETFQELLLKIIREGGLSYDRWCNVRYVGVHSDNREKAGLLPIDVHALLCTIIRNGWSWLKCKAALACEMPHDAKEKNGKFSSMRIWSTTPMDILPHLKVKVYSF